MPARFTEQERARITEALLSAGYDLFTSQGLRKTSMDELTQRAGIAKASFYAFFDSKEHLYHELLIRQAPEIARKWIPAANEVSDARSGLVSMLTKGWEVATTDPLYRRLVRHPEDLEAVQERVSTADDQDRVRPYVLEPLLDFIEHWQRAGQIVDADPYVVIGVIRAASLIVVHADEFGPQYSQIAELLTQVVAAGLTRIQEEGDR